MLIQTDLVAKGLVAQLAGKGAAPAGVGAARVHLQPVRRREELLTLHTRKHQFIHLKREKKGTLEWCKDGFVSHK